MSVSWIKQKENDLKRDLEVEVHSEVEMGVPEKKGCFLASCCDCVWTGLNVSQTDKVYMCQLQIFCRKYAASRLQSFEQWKGLETFQLILAKMTDKRTRRLGLHLMALIYLSALIHIFSLQ